MASRSNLTDAQKRLQKHLDLASESVIQYAAPQVPEIGNLTPEGMLEELGRLNAARKAIEKTEKIVKERFKSIFNGHTLRSDNFNVKIDMREATRLDQTAAKEKLVELGGQEALDACMNHSETEFVTIKEN